MASKTNPGHYFEDFSLGQVLPHATPRTVSEGDISLYTALYGSRFAVQSADTVAQSLGYPGAPLDDFLAFHVVFGKTVGDISLNAVANLGYADGRFLAPVYPGDTLRTTSEVIGLKENSSGSSGVVYVRSTGTNQHGEAVIDYVRWVMVHKRDPQSPAPQTVIPELPDCVAVENLVVPYELDLSAYDITDAGGEHLWEDYSVGERIDHVDGFTIEEAEHMLATRLYQNTAKVHFNQHVQKDNPLARRLVYGGHIISLARSLSYNGLANAQWIAAINAGRHVAPCFAGDTIYAWSEVLAVLELPDRRDMGALRLRTIATRDQPCGDYPGKNDGGDYHPGVVLDLDYTVLIPRGSV
jgi:2-methylfumaryl-CoA hydratase